MARGLNGNVNYLTTEALKVNVSSCRGYSRGRASLSEKRPDIYRRHNALIKWYVGTNFWACTYSCSYAAAMRRQLGARFRKCLKSDKPQKVLIKNLPLDFENVRAGGRGRRYAIPKRTVMRAISYVSVPFYRTLKHNPIPYGAGQGQSNLHS